MTSTARWLTHWSWSGSAGRCSWCASSSAARSATRISPERSPASAPTSSRAGYATSRAQASSRSGVCRRRPPPASTSSREYGEELREPLYALGRWGARSLGPPTAKDNLAPGWLVNAVQATCRGCSTDKVYELRIDDESVTARFENRELIVESGTSPDADTVIETDPGDTLLHCVGPDIDRRRRQDEGAQGDGRSSRCGAVPLALQLRRPPARCVTRARARLRGARRSAPSSARRLR